MMKNTVLRNELAKAKDNSKLNEANIKEWFIANVWNDMFEGTVDQSLKEDCADSFCDGYFDGASEEDFDTSFDWNNITEDSVINYSYNRGLEERYNDICDRMTDVEDELEYELSERAERDYYI